MHGTLRKWRAVYSIAIQETIAYRASMLIWILTDTTTAITMPLVWASAARVGTIQGYAVGEMTLYYLCTLIVTSFVTCHMMWDVAYQVREGVFSIYLVRPMSYYQWQFVNNLAWRTLRPLLALPIFGILYWLYQPILKGAHLHFSPEFWVSLFMGHLVSFSTVMAMASISLFVQEAFAIFELYYVPHLFLSGYMFPVALLPDWARNLTKMLPFYYTNGAPVEMLVGKLSGPAAMQTIVIQAAWVVGALWAGQKMWKLGLRHYTAVGM